MLYWFPRAATVKYHQLGGFNSRDIMSQRSRDVKSKITILAGLVASEDCEGRSVPGLSP